MANSSWINFGASVIGPSHIKRHSPNQDAFKATSKKWGDAVVVSDGVGSCPTSEYGSLAACRAVVFEAEEYCLTGDVNRLLTNIRRRWLKILEPFKPEKSAATCLFAIRPNEGDILLGMLGDGLISVLKANGGYEELSDDKEDSFGNLTAALSKDTKPDEWRILTVPQNQCRAVLLCTDGVSEDISDKEKFIRNMYDEAKERPDFAVTREIYKMLRNWPTPKHSDDKTIVCLCRYGDKNEQR